MKSICAIVLGAGVLLALPMVSTFANEQELPPSAKPGECYARVFTPAVYSTSTEQVMKNEASEKIEVIPAKYEWTTEQVLVKEASEKLEVIPARYDWAEEKILVKPASTVWKKGSGPVQKIDGHTGEIMCLVEEPAVYKTVRRRVMASPATTRTTVVPAEYTTVKVRKLANPPQERRIQIPAEYATLTKRTMVADGGVDWTPVLCQTNMSSDVIVSVQRALSSAGHSPGAIDGRLGPATMTAIRSFQRAKGLATGALTMDTLNALNIRIGG